MQVKKGWFAIDGVQTGDRTLAEQLQGLEFALTEAPGKTVLDLGCAEGCIAQAFVRAGARAALGIDNNRAFIDHAVAMNRHQDTVFYCQDLNAGPDYVDCVSADSDIVLMLAILHKLCDPAKSLREWAAFARDLIVIRLPAGSDGEFGYKHGRHMRCDVRAELPPLGFALERDLPGPRGEKVHYWRRR